MFQMAVRDSDKAVRFPMESSTFFTSLASCGRVLLFTAVLICLLGHHGNAVAEPTGNPTGPSMAQTSTGYLATDKLTTSGKTESVKQTQQPSSVIVSEPGDEKVQTSAATAETGSTGHPKPAEIHVSSACGPTASEKSWICDANSVLQPKQAEEIDNLLATANANASCVCNCSSNNSSDARLSTSEGYALAVSVVRSLPGEDHSSFNRTFQLKQLSDSLRHDWFTDRPCDDSALILAHFMYNCSKIHVSLGKDLSNLLPEGALSSIYEVGKPSLESGDVGPALVLTIQQLTAALEEASNAQPPPDNLVWGIVGVLSISSILLFHYWIKY